MPEVLVGRDRLSEVQFAAYVAELKTDPARSSLLADLLKEDNPVYEQRGTAATVRMRGCILLAFEHLGLPGSALIYVLEELDNGRDAYLLAAAARVLRSSAAPKPAMAAFLIRALTNIRDRDDIVNLQNYGGYSVSEPGTTAVREILESLRWLGVNARAVLPGLEAARAKPDGRFSTLMLDELDRTIDAVRRSAPANESPEDDCCGFLSGLGAIRLWPSSSRGTTRIHAAVLEDQDGNKIKFGDFFRGQPSIVAFFYSRCDNPRKCSLTIAKLARVQTMLADQGLENCIRTAAITYDPEYDLPERLRGYGRSRGVRMDGGHRMLRATDGMGALRAHFHPGVNFIESLVNRHRVEVYVLNASGEVVVSFERIRWDEGAVIDQAVKLLTPLSSEDGRSLTVAVPPQPTRRKEPHSSPETDVSPGNRSVAREILATALPVVTAFLPKCPMCWVAYLSFLGIVSLRWVSYATWLFPLFAGLMLINLGSLWRRGLRRDSLAGFYFAAAGAFSILALGMGLNLPFAAPTGVVLTLVGSLLNAVSPETLRGFARAAPVKQTSNASR